MIRTKVILPQFAMIGRNRLGMGTLYEYNLHYPEMEGKRRMPSRGIKPTTLHTTSKMCCCTCIKQLFWSNSSGFPAPWYSGWEEGSLRDPEVVAFFMAVCTRTTTWAKSVQTTVPHGFGYIKLLACPHAQRNLWKQLNHATKSCHQVAISFILYFCSWSV